MERTFIDVKKEVIIRSYNGSIAKAVVETIAEVTPLQIASVIQDTDNTYRAVLSLEGFPYPILMGNNNSSFLVGLANSSNGWLTNVGAGQSFSSRTTAAGTTEYYVSPRVVFSSIGGIINGLQINLSSSNMLSAVFSWAISEFTGEKIGIFYYSSTANGTWNSYIFPNSGNATEYSIYADTLVSGICKYPYSTATNLIPAAMGAEYVWVPIRTFGYYAPSVWFGRLLWGGKYTMYRLSTPNFNTLISVIPNVNYVVDGQIYKGCFNELLDLREG